MRKAPLAGCLAALLLVLSGTAASAETLMMPNRDALVGNQIVVWGVTDLPNGSSTFTMDFGDGVVTSSAVVGDRSYIALTHTYASGGAYTATLTVTNGATTESATATIQVFDATVLTADSVRNVRINNAIQDGLRYLWTAQISRAANFPANPQTHWGGSWPHSWSSLVVLAFENHGYRLPDDNSMPTGIYEKYIVRRGLNYMLNGLERRTVAVEGTMVAGQPVRDPCVGGVEASPCTALQAPGSEGYATPIAMLPLAASGALNRTVVAAEAPGTASSGFILGRSYGEILQRMANGLAWGQVNTGAGRGGWYYTYNGPGSDGSIVGWALLGMLDAEAAGSVVPGWVKSEFAFALNSAHNNNGTFDYQADGNPNALYYPNFLKTGIALQGLFFTGQTPPFAAGTKAAATLDYLSNYWNSNLGGQSYICTNGRWNKGCSYGMFNAFKGLKLLGIDTLPGVARPAGPGSQPANDWYADYQDWLIANQTDPTTTGGGYWSGMRFSGIADHTPANVAIAELILSPVALVLPDPVKFATIGLQPFTATATQGGTHTATAKAEATNGAPVPGATVNFTVLTGPNAGKTGSGVTNANGETTFTYTDTSAAGGTDTIRANIGTLNSNIVDMIWTPLNSPPVAVDDAFQTDEDVALNANVTGNDTDADGDTLTATLVSGTANGTLVFNADGSFTYTPAANWSGSDSFTYKLNDGTADSGVATVTITVNPVNDPPVCTAATPSTTDLWPPNNRWVSVTVNGVTDPVEGSAVTINIDSIFQDEPVGSGNNAGGADGQGVGTSTAQVRAQRSGGGGGRVYHISFTATDAGGATCSGVVKVSVLHDTSGTPATDDGPLFDSTVPAAAVAAATGNGKN